MVPPVRGTGRGGGDATRTRSGDETGPGAGPSRAPGLRRRPALRGRRGAYSGAFHVTRVTRRAAPHRVRGLRRGRHLCEEPGKQSPMGRPAHPAEMAPAFVFLASQGASFITAEVVNATGGTPLP
ncbi:SDR family oxidoreductase [Streptomyces sp. BV286]|uniref:SDR family oxidoreductase n=1 Tax=Streptomyces sp. BV286 TaxID=2849672 RepID=UPI0027E3CC20|nr:SDR family oxidoreductase [Streptomyces sp. BV286]